MEWNHGGARRINESCTQLFLVWRGVVDDKLSAVRLASGEMGRLPRKVCPLGGFPFVDWRRQFSNGVPSCN
jgi:hypothetical protein